MKNAKRILETQKQISELSLQASLKNLSQKKNTAVKTFQEILGGYKFLKKGEVPQEAGGCM